MTEPTNAGNNPPLPDRSTGDVRARHGDRARSAADPLPASRKRLGLSARGERILSVAGPVFIALFVGAWIWSIRIANAAEARGEMVARPSSRVTAALTREDAPTVSYVKDAALEALARRARGTSGQLRAAFVLPTEVNQALNAVNSVTQIVLTPFTEKQRGRIGGYMLGSWPGERARGRVGPARAPADRYANPRGFIQVTPQNQNTQVSQHFQLRHFLTKNQPTVWPKYLLLETRLIDKLELVLTDLRSQGINTTGITVMSGFRTPSYNAGGGNTSGRADLSRHMYGDAADVYIDNDRDGNMDDLNGDGRVNIGDARLMEEAVNRVERAHPELIGGTGVYVACCGHGPFIHIDTRGYRARWTGSSGG